MVVAVWKRDGGLSFFQWLKYGYGGIISIDTLLGGI